jgi:Flp pilus assembly protein TadD
VRRAAELAPDDQQVLTAQVVVAAGEGRYEQALAAARRVQALRPDDASGYLLESQIEMNRKNWEPAAAVLRKALTRNQPADAAQRLHAVLVAGGKKGEAEALAADWRKKHPDDLAFILYQGDTALASGDKAGAESHYRAVLAARPDHMLALNNLAYLLASDKKPGAVEMAEKALQRAPRAAAVMDTLAFALAAEGKLPKALEMQRQAVAAAPDQPNFKLQLAKLLLQSGDKAGARAELSSLAALGNKYPRQAEVAEMVKAADR